MNKATTRIAIIVLTLYTAIVHLVLLNLNGILPLFVLNGLGYLALLAALLLDFPKGQGKLVHYGFIGFTAVTVIAWLVMNGDFTSILGVSTKAAEVLLIICLWMDLS